MVELNVTFLLGLGVGRGAVGDDSLVLGNRGDVSSFVGAIGGWLCMCMYVYV